MLRPFLFVGCGGSGLRTLRRVRRDLEDALAFRGVPASEFPDAWQFIAVDVPSAEQIEPGLAEYSHGSYVGLSAPGIGYQGAFGIDDVLSSKANTMFDFATWRPNPATVAANVAIGAGQYRAVGRAVAAYSLDDRLASRIGATVERMQSPSAMSGLLAIQERLLGPDVKLDGNAPQPIVVLVSSLGGGAGSGIFIDVADAIRRSADASSMWLHNIVGILYDPSIFTGGASEPTGGIAANSLGAINELVAGHWAPWGDFPYIPSLFGNPGVARGPRHSFIVGRTNGTITLPDANAVYSSVANYLATLVTRPDALRPFEEFTIGNWGQASSKSRGLNLHDNNLTNQLKPVSAIGFGRISLGRPRFRVFAKERISSGALERIVRRPMIAGEFDDKLTDEQVIEQLIAKDRNASQGLVYTFLNECQLNESSAENDQILDAIRPAEELATAIANEQDRIVAMVNDPKSMWAQYEQAYNLHGKRAEKELAQAVVNRAYAWAADIQPRVLDVAARWVATRGLRLTAEVLRAIADEEFGKLFSEELTAEATVEDKKARATWDALNQRINGVKSGRTVSQEAKGLMKEGVLRRLSMRLERDLRVIVAALLRDMAAEFIGPIIRSLDEASKLANLAFASEAYEVLSKEQPRPSLRPAPNEILITSTDDYASDFTKLVKSLGDRASEDQVQIDCLAGMIGEITQTTELERDDLRPWVETNFWTPNLASPDSSLMKTAVPIRVSFNFDLPAIMRRADAWLAADPKRGFGQYLNETLRGYLTDCGPADQQTRAKEFAVTLQQLFAIARPLAGLNAPWMAKQYGHDGSCVFGLSGIPLDPSNNKDSYTTVAQVVNTVIADPGTQARAFDGESRGDVELVTVLNPTVPAAFGSFVDGVIASFRALKDGGHGEQFWDKRRARPLLESIPLPRSTRLTLARGWIIAALRGAIQIEGETGKRRCVLTIDGKPYVFMDPPIGEEPPSRKPTRWFATILESALLAEMLASVNDTAALESLEALLKLGFAEDTLGPTESYQAVGAGLASCGYDQLPGIAAVLGEQRTGDRIADIRTALQSYVAKYNELAFTPMKDWAEYPSDSQVAPLLIEAANQIAAALEDEGGGVFV